VTKIFIAQKGIAQHFATMTSALKSGGGRWSFKEKPQRAYSAAKLTSYREVYKIRKITVKDSIRKRSPQVFNLPLCYCESFYL